MAEFSDSYGPWALILGASEGLGEAFAREAAQRGLNVALVARRAEVVQETAALIAKEYPVKTLPIGADVGAPDLLATLEKETAGLEIGMIVYNAAAGHIGPFLDQGIEETLHMIDVNCRGPVLIANHLARGMVERGRGGLIFMSSGAALAGTPGTALYAAGKAFELVLGEGLARELKPHGVHVLSVIGPVIDTPNFWTDDPDTSNLIAPPVPAPDVAREAYDQLGKVSSCGVGDGYRDAFALMDSLPREQRIEAMESTTLSMYGDRAAGPRGS